VDWIDWPGYFAQSPCERLPVVQELEEVRGVGSAVQLRAILDG
jgi:hypothetical protein